MAIYITGDIHGSFDIERLANESWEGRTWRPRSEDYLVIVGDVGCIYHTKTWELPDYAPEDREVIDILCSQPWTVLFVDGNHENHLTLGDLEVETWHGGLVHRVAPRLLHLMRGQVYDVDGLSLFTMGGAHSPDWVDRIEGESWWSEEMPDEEEYDDARKNLIECGWECDLVLSHTCPGRFLGEILDEEDFAEPDELTDFLDEIYDKLDFGRWVFGHFHEELFSFSDPRLTGLFESLVRLDRDTLELELVE